MALAYSIVKRRPDVREVVVDVTLDGSYGAGGYALDNKSLGVISTPESVVVAHYVHATATADHVAEWDPANNKLKIFQWGGTSPDPLVEAAAGDITTSHKVRLIVKGDPIL